MNKNFDVLVIGCGPAGMAAAECLRANNLNVGIVENGKWGGVCLNSGCIPTKMILAASKTCDQTQIFKKQKVVRGLVEIDYEGLMKRVGRYTRGVSASIPQTLESSGAVTFTGNASFISPKEIIIKNDMGETFLKAEKFIIATGSLPLFYPGLEPDHEKVVTCDDLLGLKQAPASLCVIGAGAIGLEMGSFYQELGTEIHYLDTATRIAPGFDEDIIDVLKNSLLKKGSRILTNVNIGKIEREDKDCVVHLTDGRSIKTEKVLIATGRKGNPPSGLNQAGCELNQKDFIKVDDCLMATPHIYAVGDCNGKTLLAHAAAHQARYVVHHLTEKTKEAYSPGLIPACIYGEMEIFQTGLNEAQAKEISKEKTQTSRSQLAANPVAQAGGYPQGFIKAIWLDNELRGLTAVGHNVTELVTTAELLILGDYNPEKLNAIMIAHPTLSEALIATIDNKNVKAT